MSAEIRADEIIRRLILPATGVEVGVAIGQTSEALLRNPHIHLYMVDSWEEEKNQTESYKNSGDWHAHCTYEQQTSHMNEAIKVTEFAKKRREVIRLPSVEASRKFEDKSLDFVFIDADHSYEGCKADIEAWKDKVKSGGWLCGHDYGHPIADNKEWTWGPKKAVDEAVKKYGWKLELGGNFTWFVKISDNTTLS